MSALELHPVVGELYWNSLWVGRANGRSLYSPSTLKAQTDAQSGPANWPATSANPGASSSHQLQLPHQGDHGAVHTGIPLVSTHYGPSPHTNVTQVQSTPRLPQAHTPLASDGLLGHR